MPTTVLQMVQQFTDKLGLPTPTALVGSSEKSIKQYLALMNQTVRDLGEYRWQQQTIQGTFISTAVALQGDLETLLPGYAGLIKDSMWNQTRLMRVYGPMSEQVWNALTLLPNAGPEFQSWISQNNLYFSPPTAAGETILCTYVTNNCVLAVDGVTYKTEITVDSDSLIFPLNPALRYFEALWRQQKGESGWQDHYNDAMGLVAKNIVRDGTTTLAMDSNDNRGLQPGIVIPPGSWNV